MRPLFAATDLERQKTTPALRRLGARHVAYGARPEHYPIVGEVLIAALAEVAGAAWRPEYERAWNAGFGLVAGAMLEGAHAAMQGSCDTVETAV